MLPQVMSCIDHQRTSTPPVIERVSHVPAQRVALAPGPAGCSESGVGCTQRSERRFRSMRADVRCLPGTPRMGRLTAAHLAEHAPPGTRIALAGRSRDKLAAVRDGLPAAGRTWPLLEADATDPASLAALAAATRVVVTTVGPYARHGLPLVEACAGAGTHYADLTGEVLFVRDALRFDDAARESGARIVHSCGFDSIPSDLAVLLLHERAAADGAGGLRDVRLVASMRGGFSGGTIDSIRQQVDTMRGRPPGPG